MRKVISALMSAIMLLVMLAPAASALSFEDARIAENIALKEAMKEQEAYSQIVGDELTSTTSGYIRNDFIEAYIATNGQYTMGTVEGDPSITSDNNKLLLFGHPSPWSSETLVRIDDNDYLFHNYVTDVSINSNGSQAIATATIDDVVVKQYLTIETNPYTNTEDIISIRYTYTNRSSAVKQVGIRIMLDTMLGNNDGSPFRVNGIEVTTEKEYSGNNVPQYWQCFDNLTNPNVTATGFFYYTQNQKPDKVQFCYWGAIRSSSWGFSISESRSVTSDSAVGIYFNPKSVASGRTGTIETYYGISAFTSANTDLSAPLAVRVTAPEALTGRSGGGYNNNPFDVRVYLDNVSEETLSDVKVRVTFDGTDKLALSNTSQSNTISVGNMNPGGTSSLGWTIRALPQERTVTANYTLSFYSGTTLLKTMPLSIGLVQVPTIDLYRTVTFVLNGGTSLAPTTQQVRFGSYVTKPASPTRTGYLFDGWYSNPSCTGVSWFDFSNALGRGLPVTSDITLYAKWTKSQDITYRTDTFNFENCEDDFFSLFTSEKRYTLTGDYYDILIDGLTNSETTSINQKRNNTWGGSCYGMSCVLSLVKAHKLNVSYFQGNASKLFDLKAPKNSSTICNLINYYQLSWHTDRTSSVYFGDTQNETSNNRRVIEALNESSYPVVLGFVERSSSTNEGIWGHAVVAYGYERVSNGYNVKIWDPNHKNTPDTLFISNDFSTSRFTNHYDTSTSEYSYLCRAFTVESRDFDHRNIEERLRNLGHTSGDQGNSTYDEINLQSNVSEKNVSEAYDFYLTTNYNSFDINDSSGRSARIENGYKISGNLEISDGYIKNVMGSERELEFIISSSYDVDYTIIPSYGTSVLSGEPLETYSTTMVSNDPVNGFYSRLLAEDIYTVLIKSDGTLTSSFEEPTQQLITVVANDAVTPWYMVDVVLTDTSATVIPNDDSTQIICTPGTTISVMASDDYNSATFESYVVTEGTATLSESTTEEGKAVLNGETAEMGYSLIFYSMGGTPIPAQVNIPEGALAERPEDPTREGFVFDGWYTTPECEDGTEWYFSTPITENTRIYAKWLTDRNLLHTVTFKIEGQDDIVYIVYDGESLSVEQLPEIPYRPGYVGLWDISDFTNITQDIIATAIYQRVDGYIELGDIDGDGIPATPRDAMILARYIAGWPGYDSQIYLEAADLDNDGIPATPRDAMILARHIAGWPGYEILPIQ